MPRGILLDEYKRAYEELEQLNSRFVDQINDVADVLDDAPSKDRLFKALQHFEEIDQQMAADDKIFATLVTVDADEPAKLEDLYKKEYV